MGKPRKKRDKILPVDQQESGQSGPKWEKAAQLIADNNLIDQDIAQQCGIGRSTLTRWKNKPEFQEIVAKYKRSIANHFVSKGVRSREDLIANLQHRIDLMTRLLAARGVDQDGQIRGGELGLMAMDYKGNNAQRKVFRFDDKLVKELREHEKQLAILTGQWNEQGPGGEAPNNDKVIDLITMLYNDAKGA